MFIGQQSVAGVPTVDDILRIIQCKLLMPFTDDFSDHSIHKKNTGILTGNLNISENGAVFTRTQNMYIDCPLNISDDYTVEILVTITNDTHETYFLGGQGANTFYLCYSNITKSFYFGRHGSNSAKDTETIVELNKMYHVALVMSRGYYKAYINGKQVTSVDVNNAKPTADTTRIYLGRPYTDLNVQNYSLDGIIGGLKITSKALNPSEFSLTRPFKIPNTNMSCGNKTYLYKEGILDSRISLPADSFWIENGHIATKGTANFSFLTNGLESRKIMLCAQCNPSVSASNDGTRLYMNAMKGSIILSEAFVAFPGGSSKYSTEYFGINLLSCSGFDSLRIGTSCLSNQIWINEIWYE